MLHFKNNKLHVEYTQKTKVVSVVILVVGASSWNARRFLFKIYSFS